MNCAWRGAICGFEHGARLAAKGSGRTAGSRARSRLCRGRILAILTRIIATRTAGMSPCVVTPVGAAAVRSAAIGTRVREARNGGARLLILRARSIALGILLVGGPCMITHGPASAKPREPHVAPHDAKSVVTDHATGEAVGQAERVRLIADRDDDDVDEVADADATVLSPSARADLVALDARYVGAILTPRAAGERARVVVNGKPLGWGERLPAGAQLQGIAPGHLSLLATTGTRRWLLSIDVHGVGFRDGSKRNKDIAREHASIARTPPSRVDLDDADLPFDDPDALRIVTSSPDGSALGAASVESLSPDGSSLDLLRDVSLTSVACEHPLKTNATCMASAPLRLVADDADRKHPLVEARSLRAEVGGAIVVRDSAGKKLQAIRVAGPRESEVGPIGRHRVTIRPVVVRMNAGGAPAVGGTDAGAVALVRAELTTASATWGQCGITFGPIRQLEVTVVNPPPPYLVAIGDDVGLPASGGEIRLRIDGRPASVTTKKGWSARQVALEIQRVARSVGASGVLSENARTAPGAFPSVDVALKRGDGQLSTVELVSNSDATLSVRVGAVDMTDGLQHFNDTDSVAGTLEERTLVKAVDDGDPTTIELIVVPYFAGGGRIGESFIASDGSSIRNVVIVDRAGIRARRSSLTLAHELGHVILDEPGHPDDYSADTPSLLMDSDASDSSPFGPRRLTTSECSRAIRQSGPHARIPLLTEWKLGTMKYAINPLAVVLAADKPEELSRK